MYIERPSDTLLVPDGPQQCMTSGFWQQIQVNGLFLLILLELVEHHSG